MKKLIAFITALTMVFMTACSGSTEGDSSKTALPTADDTSSVSETTTTTASSMTTTTTQTTAYPQTTTSAVTSDTSAADTLSSNSVTVKKSDYADRLFAERSGNDLMDTLELFKKYLIEIVEKSGKPVTDTDKDGIPDVLEAQAQTDPEKADTDGDGLDDLVELVLTRTDPTNPMTDGKTNDAKADSDKDGLSNEREIALKISPANPDTDSDGLNDGDEVNKYHTDPLKSDTDGDTINDGDEAELGTDPLHPVTNGIADNKHYIKQTIPEDSEALRMVNKFGESPYKVSLEYEAVGSAKRYILVSTSRHAAVTNYMKDVVVGSGVEISSYGDFKSKNGVIKFRIDKDYINKNLKGKKLANGADGIKRLAIYAVPDYIGLERIKTQYDEANGIVYAQMNGITDFALVDEYLYAERIVKSAEEYQKYMDQQKKNTTR